MLLCLHLDIHLFEQQNKKKLYGTENKYVHSSCDRFQAKRKRNQALQKWQFFFFFFFGDLLDCSPPGSTIHGIFQARILSRLPSPSPGDLPDPGIKPMPPKLAGGRFTYFRLVQFSCSVMSDSLQPHGLQYASPPCPSAIPRAYSNSCPLNR